MIVLDASILLKYVAREPGWIDVEQRILVRSCATLALAFTEVAQALEALARRGGSIERARVAAKALSELARSGVVRVLEDWRYVPRALELAPRLRIPVAEAMYIAAAEESRELATCVRRQAVAARELGIEVILIS
ncbi:MAG: type II toxin-antitoxin system VapC family toxin [Crenarchaeota archaeon]|nr:type II toxin-antitoxin system VapC family toxin [Thermoproteota archaeon]